jgi:hypothetical protein
VNTRATDKSDVTSSGRALTSFWLLIALLALCAGGKAVLYDTLDPDCFWHLKVAEQLRQDGVGPLVDRLSFASIKEPWTPYSWLAELGMKWVWDIGGYRGAIAIQALMAAAFVTLLAAGATAVAGSSRTSTLAATVFSAFLSLPYLSFRPATAALVLLAACHVLMRRERSRMTWLVIPLMALLANVHLYVFLVPLWITAFSIGEAMERRPLRRSKILLCFTLAASLLTPMLPGVLRAIWHYQFRDDMVAGPAIAEMQPFWHGSMGAISAVLLITFFVCVAVGRRQLRPRDWILLAGSTALLLLHGRYTPLFAIVAAPILAQCLPRLSERPFANRWLWPAVTALLIFGGVRIAGAFPSRAMALNDWLNRHGPDAPGYPTSAAAFVDRSVRPDTGRLLNEFSWGGYLEWRLANCFQVLADGRTQLYPPHFWRATELGTPNDLQSFIVIQSADAAIVPAKPSGRLRTALIGFGWQVAFADERAEVLLPPHSHLAPQDREAISGF